MIATTSYIDILYPDYVGCFGRQFVSKLSIQKTCVALQSTLLCSESTRLAPCSSQLRYTGQSSRFCEQLSRLWRCTQHLFKSTILKQMACHRTSKTLSMLSCTSQYCFSLIRLQIWIFSLVGCHISYWIQKELVIVL